MKKGKPYLLSIAGFDPSGGAGVLADIKTFEAHKVTGFGIVTNLTFQTENKFLGLEEISYQTIEKQLDPLLNQYEIKFVKVGLVKDLKMALFIFEKLKTYKDDMFIVWDPVMGSSSGYDFWASETQNKQLLSLCLKNINLVTPNVPELKKMFGNDIELGIKNIVEHCHLVLKGGHQEKEKAVDVFVEKNDVKRLKYKSKKISLNEKHGSGCVFSASLLSNLALGYGFHHAMLKTKRYMNKFFNSSQELLGYHKF
ncbi:MAG: hydroxymethylpyrimidine/phosphomethylpyrimidine kinase [Cytophagales bacterium]